MARNIQSLLRITSNVFNKNITSNICVSGARTLFSASALGIDGYKKTRDNIHQQFANMNDKFREKMQAYVEGESRNMVFTEDLKNMLHLVNDDSNDLNLLLQMMIKFNAQNEQMRFGSYIFGPVVMRTYHYLNKPDEAMAAFNNPALEGFFDQVVSYQILMDLLYNHKRYAELKQVFESILTRHTDYTRHPRHAVTLVLAGCYKENTPESMEYAMNLWKELKDRGNRPQRRSSTFFAGLTLNQGKPDVCAEVLFNVREGNYITVRNLKVAALADLDRLEDVVPILRMSVASDNPSLIKQTYTKDVIDKVEAAIQRAGLSGTETIVNLVRQLEQNDHIIGTTLDDLISSEIVGFVRSPGQPGQTGQTRRPNFDNSSYGSNNDTGYQQTRPRRQFNQYQRTGLKELI